jgi:hypothetical protein
MSTTTTTRTLKQIRAEIRIENDKARARRLRDAATAAAALAYARALPPGERRDYLLSSEGRHRGEPRAHHVLRRLRLRNWFFATLTEAIAAATPPSSTR